MADSNLSKGCLLWKFYGTYNWRMRTSASFTFVKRAKVFRENKLKPIYYKFKIKQV